jgi:hypothetical protein
LVSLESTVRLKEPQKTRKTLKTLKTKEIEKRYSALTNVTHRHVEIDVRKLGKVQNVQNNVN